MSARSIAIIAQPLPRSHISVECVRFPNTGMQKRRRGTVGDLVWFPDPACEESGNQTIGDHLLSASH